MYILISFFLLTLTHKIHSYLYIIYNYITIAIRIHESSYTHLYPYKVGTINSQRKIELTIYHEWKCPQLGQRGERRRRKATKGGCQRDQEGEGGSRRECRGL